MSFVHLHNHSYYSLLQSPASPEKIAKIAKEQGCTAVALTDNAVMYGGIEFYKACKNEGIKAILGMEIYLAPRSLHQKEKRSDGITRSLVLLAENQIGYNNLLKLSSIAHLEGMYYKPRLDLDVLTTYKEGLIALSGGLNGEISHAILEHYLEEDIENIVKKYLKIFGKNNFFLEIAYHPNLSSQSELNERLIILGQKMKIPLVAAQNTYYLQSTDAEAQDILFCIGTNRQFDDDNRPTMIDEDYSFLSLEEIKEALIDTPEAISNTVKIADRCHIEFDLKSYHIPEFKVPANSPAKTALDYFRYECINGLKKRYPQFTSYLNEINYQNYQNITTIVNNSDLLTQYELAEENFVMSDNPQFSGYHIAKRFEHEFSIIKNMGFESYFLMVWDYIKWSKDHQILVGPGRGSGAGSIIAYALEITNLEPLQYSLLFERFLNPERISMPDFDIDFQDDRRNEVLQYVTEKYGSDHVAQISTFGTLTARAAIKDVGRTLGVPFSKMNIFSKLIPDKPGTTLADAWEEEEELRQTVNNNVDLKRVWEIASKLEGCVRHISVHACAVVISSEPLNQYTAIQNPPKDDTTIISQYSAKPLEALGLLKMDFLGLKNLTILDTAIKIIKRLTGNRIDLDNINMTDEATLKIFQEGFTTGVFQFESSGMKRYLKELKPTRFEDLIAMNSLYRPGPMEFIPDFIKRKHGEITIEYPHESVKEILEPTYGIAVYQEQILQMAQVFAGYSLGQADILRRAIGKKIASEMDKQRAVFIQKAEELKRDKKIAEYIFDKVIVPFAGYGFNKSHAAAYSLIAYQTAYLKAHYPNEFMAALLTSDQDNPDRIAIEIEECRLMGIEILPPSVNDSLRDFTVVKNKQIRFGLSAIKNLGDSGVDAILQARTKDEIPFKNLADFINRLDVNQLNRKNLEALAKSGAMDTLAERNAILNNVDEIIEYTKEIQFKNSSGQIGLFDFMDSPTAVNLNLKPTVPASFSQNLAWEKEFLGLFISAHPLGGLSLYWTQEKKFFLINQITPETIDQNKKFAGIISNLRLIKTKKQENMAMFYLCDPSGKIEVTVFPQGYNEYKQHLVEDKFVIIESKIIFRQDAVQLNIEKVSGSNLDELRQDAIKKNLLDLNQKHLIYSEISSITKSEVEDAKREPWLIELPLNITREILETIKNIFDQNPGSFEVILQFASGEKKKLKQKVNVTKVLKNHIKQILQTNSNYLIKNDIFP